MLYFSKLKIISVLIFTIIISFFAITNFIKIDNELFKRNIKNLEQLNELTSHIRSAINDPLYPIMIDEEGGRVTRLSKIIDFSDFPQNYFGKLYEKNIQTYAR